MQLNTYVETRHKTMIIYKRETNKILQDLSESVETGIKEIKSLSSFATNTDQKTIATM